ncbi:MAG TPA: efflux RND transporter periplasmic adaptor subunit [Rhodanobacteraceae bacterium]|nr:efflux RND transporter periplasmic adaptor subunit [Rhodanobacteraceae bacterium]
MSRGKIALIVIAAIIVAVVLFRVFGGGSHRLAMGQAQEHAPIPVTVVPVTQEDVPVFLTANGTVQALHSVTVRPQVAGQLMSLEFTEGGQVKKGQVLAKIDPRTYQAKYDQAVAHQRQDQAQLDTARSNLERAQDLIEKHYISKQDLTTLENTVHQLVAAVSADAAAVRDAKIDLDYTTINSPIDGLAGIRNVDPGNILTTSDTIVTITQLRPINVFFSLPAETLDSVRAAQAAATLPVEALDTTSQHVLAGNGKLTVIDNQIDVTTGTYRLKAEFPNKDGELWPGQAVNVRLRVSVASQALVVPTVAVQRGPDGDYVYLLQPDNTVKMQPVTTGNEADTSHVIISKGLAAGDKVVTEGQFRLKPGSKVKPMAPGEVPAPPTTAEIKKASQQRGRGRHH